MSKVVIVIKQGIPEIIQNGAVEVEVIDLDNIEAGYAASWDSNKIDEFQMMHLYEELFGNDLKLQHGWTNHYVHKVDGKEVRYSFTELKQLIIDKLNAS